MRTVYFGAALMVAAGVLSAGARPAVAADTKHSFAVHGVGALSCAEMANAMTQVDPQTKATSEAAVRSTLASWMLGYVTALNRTDAATYDATPVQDDAPLVNMVIGVCSKNPTARVETVVSAIFTSLEKAKLPVESPEVKVTVGTQSTVLRAATLLSLEKALVAQKLLKSADADGKFNDNVKAALVKYQTAQKLPQTGLPDADTVIRALVETPQKG
ncbi:MAG: peptidoglycan-binding domain-containing protein [Acidocella sp.]|nr:peptidoglycan-binding domain-containing protein [Acidocella sp.]